MPRCSCPYAGTTRIRFEGLPRPSGISAPCRGHPLDEPIIRRVIARRQGPPPNPPPQAGEGTGGGVARGPDRVILDRTDGGAGVAMIVGRVIGWIVFLAGAAVLVRDLLVWIDTKHWAPIALGQLWYDLNRSSLNLVQAVVQRYIHPFLWDPIIVTILLWWAFAVLMVLGVLLHVVFRKSNARR